MVSSNGELLRSSPLKNKSKIHTLFLGRNFVKEHSRMPEHREREREREHWFGDHESPHKQIPALLRKAMRFV
jgi:hypothetical protein